jgi:hypothetical protein
MGTQIGLARVTSLISTAQPSASHLGSLDFRGPVLLVHRECAQCCVSVAVDLHVLAHIFEPLRVHGVGLGKNDVSNATEDGDAFGVLDLVGVITYREDEEDTNVQHTCRVSVVV